jgi:hypothetical protein
MQHASFRMATVPDLRPLAAGLALLRGFFPIEFHD